MLKNASTSAFIEKSTYSRYAGFTLIELLITLGVIFILVGLLVPGVQKLRAAADRVMCANRVRQIGVAMHLFHNEYARLPPGVTSNSLASPYPLMTWQVRLLPFIEQDIMWSNVIRAYATDRYPAKNPPHVYFSKPMKTFSCPSDLRLEEPQMTRNLFKVGLTSYVGVIGDSWDRPTGCLFKDSKVRLIDIRDGTTHTIMVGERPPSPDFWFGWWYASEGVLGSGSPDVLLGGRENNAFGSYVGGCPTGPYVFAQGKLDNMCDVFHFWSLHPGGAHFLMADSSVHFLNYSAAPLIPELCTRNGGEVVELP